MNLEQKVEKLEKLVVQVFNFCLRIKKLGILEKWEIIMSDVNDLNTTVTNLGAEIAADEQAVSALVSFAQAQQQLAVSLQSQLTALQNQNQSSSGLVDPTAAITALQGMTTTLQQSLQSVQAIVPAVQPSPAANPGAVTLPAGTGIDPVTGASSNSASSSTGTSTVVDPVTGASSNSSTGGGTLPGNGSSTAVSS